MTCFEVLTQFAAEAQTVHHRHHHVADNDIGLQFFGHAVPLGAVGGFADPVVSFENGIQQGPQFGVVLDDQHLIAFFRGLCGNGCGSVDAGRQRNRDAFRTGLFNGCNLVVAGIPFLAGRERDGKERTAVPVVLCGQSSVVQFEDAPAQGQSDACAVVVAVARGCRGVLVERVENVGQGFFRDAASCVGKGDCNGIVLFEVVFDVHADVDASAVGRVFERIDEQVGKDSLHLFFIDARGHRLSRKMQLQTNVAVVGILCERIPDIGDKCAEVRFRNRDVRIPLILLLEIEPLHVQGVSIGILNVLNPRGGVSMVAEEKFELSDDEC